MIVFFFFSLTIKYTDFVNQWCPAIYSFWWSMIAPILELVINSSGWNKTWVQCRAFIHINSLTWLTSTTLFSNNSYLFIYQSTIEDLEGERVFFCVCMVHVYIHIQMSMYLYVCWCMYICAPRTYVCEVQRSKLVVFLNHTASYFLTQSLSLNLGLRNCWASLASRLLVSSCLSFEQCWHYRPATAMPSLGIWVLVIRT